LRVRKTSIVASQTLREAESFWVTANEARSLVCQCRASDCRGKKPGAGGGTWTLMGRLSPADFHTVYGFRRPNVTPLEGSRQVCGLDYPFTLLRKLRSLGAARL